MSRLVPIVLALILFCDPSNAQENPLWDQAKVGNYLPHMTAPEVRKLLTRTDMVIIPVASLEQHGLHLPIGTDYLNGVERAKLIAQRTDVLVAPFREGTSIPPAMEFDRHGGVGETSNSLFLMPTLVDMDSAETATLDMPDHLERMVPDVVAGDETALRVFLAEGLKAEEKGKGTSSLEMSSTGVRGVRDLQESSAEQGRQETGDLVQASVKFIERWNELRPLTAGEPR